MSSSHPSLSSQQELERRLAFYLGFEDGADGLLDHLLTMDPKEDLLDYLQQLLGYDKTESIAVFIDDVERFRRGEPLSNMEETLQLAAGSSSPPPQQWPATAAVSQHKQQQPQQQQDLKPKAKHPASSSKSSYAAMTIPKTGAATERGKTGGRADDSTYGRPALAYKSAATKPASPTAPPKSTSANMTTLKASKPGKIVGESLPPKKLQGGLGLGLNKPPTKNEHPPTNVRPARVGPSKGAATVVCGCFGTKHPPLTNCLYCGRISCEREGYDFCPFCGFLVEPAHGTASETQQNDAAWKLKEQLLQFDKDHAKRTVVLDDQADYYSNQTSAWLDDGEQEKAKQDEDRRIQDLHYRKKQHLDVAF